MKIIKQTKLFFHEGKSDKVYEIDLCEINTDAYVVNFRYGRRGANLKEGSKTPEFVSKEKAESIFDQLEKEKRNKGYQSEVEVFVELPSLDSVNMNSPEGVLLKRLEDATQGINSFKTEWKTSRVIWKAAQSGLTEAVPYILKLATKGDEMQLYASIYAIRTLKITQANELLNSLAHSTRQKQYIKNVAYDAFLQINEGEDLEKIVSDLLETLPPEVKYAIDKGDYEYLKNYYSEKFDKKEKADELVNLYLLSASYTSLSQVVASILKYIPFEAPYFKNIRAIYKLARFRNDAPVLGLLSYLFEKKPSFFQRTASLDKEAWYTDQYFPQIGYVNIRKELSSTESRLAYSNFTKFYFQKNSFYYLKNLGDSNKVQEYLKYAVNVLLQYSDHDYVPSCRKPLSEYGIYNWNDRRYYFTVVDYPECYNSLLLTTILFGNDENRKLNDKLQFYTKKEEFWSDSYYYRIDEIRKLINNDEIPPNNNEKSQGTLGNIVSTFKSIFGPNKERPQPKMREAESVFKQPQPEMMPQRNRLELHPEFWDEMPEAYIQLLMQAKMNLVMKFAYENISVHPQYKELLQKIQPQMILHLLKKPSEYAQNLGYEALEHHQYDLKQNEHFVAQVLASESEKARGWAVAVIADNTSYFFSSTEFVSTLIMNPRKELVEPIDDLLKKNILPEAQQKVVLGKVIIEMISLENNETNNEIAKVATNRLKIIASANLTEISWEIVAQLLTSPLNNNRLLASEILLLKSEKYPSTDIPVSIVELLLNNENQSVRKNGIALLHNYPKEFIEENWLHILQQLSSSYREVAESVLTYNQQFLSKKELQLQTIEKLINVLMTEQKFENSHQLFRSELEKIVPKYSTEVPVKWMIRLVFANSAKNQLSGFELLKQVSDDSRFSLKQVISLSNHEFLAVRQWAWNFYKNNINRIKVERNQALGILDAKWDDTRAFAFHFFETEFQEEDWDTDCLVSIADSVRPDVEKFGKELIMKFFRKEHGLEYLTKLSQHPSVNIQLFVTSYLEEYASNQPEKLEELEFYFRSVLTRVNRARTAKNRIFSFLEKEGKKDIESAEVVAKILDDVSATTAIQDKAKCIDIISELKLIYSQLNVHLQLIS